MITIDRIETQKALKQAASVMLELRPQFTADAMIKQITRQQANGYVLFGAFKGDDCVGVAGGVIGEKLAWGKHLYIDDLVTREDVRSEGVGEGLLTYCIEYAKTNALKSLHLDSGVQRFGAHRFYLRHEMHINSHHFALELLE
ncbi:GNAT family N-acetyltransferase [Alteromonas sp. ASW11-130]|uniref:GNAT family N-acetyltransferase n=1 Tax=Alteromonas sp. ASW11-130 TaxID=3015775 RepID=UPI00224239B1|nr:GNAT family N-acetyltransferase [Alteromonas sp. ASW11-130]MCW8092163.1 GNAT family N-acetyltransferase [Alteromonas sp. ASW11-130]